MLLRRDANESLQSLHKLSPLYHRFGTAAVTTRCYSKRHLVNFEVWNDSCEQRTAFDSIPRILSDVSDVLFVLSLRASVLIFG
jgi:hypothetical protein